MTGIDPEGIDLRQEGATARLNFADPVLTPEAARRALVALADDPALRQSIGKGAGHLAEQFTWDKIAARTSEFFEEILEALSR